MNTLITTDNIIRHYPDNSYWFIPPFDYLNPDFVLCLKAKGRVVVRLINIKHRC